MWGWGVIALILAILTYGFSWLIFPFFANAQYAQSLIKRGYINKKLLVKKKSEKPVSTHLNEGKSQSSEYEGGYTFKSNVHDNKNNVKEKKYSISIKDNFEQYSKYTKANNWKGICELNNIDFDLFGTKKELDVLPDYLDDDEVVFALTSGIMSQTETSNSFDFGTNTWLVVLTNERFLFLDCAMLTNSVDTQSIRHNHVQGVSVSQGLVLGKIMVDLGNRMVTMDNCNKTTIPVIAEIANKWLKELQQKKDSIQSNNSGYVEETPIKKLEKLAELHVMGALSDEEFKVAKEKILATL